MAAAEVEEYLKKSTPHLQLLRTVELQEFVRLVLTDEGDFEGLSQLVKDLEDRFGATVELRRESSKSFQLEILVPKTRKLTPKKTLWIVALAWSAVSCLSMLYLVNSGSFSVIGKNQSSNQT